MFNHPYFCGMDLGKQLKYKIEVSVTKAIQLDWSNSKLPENEGAQREEESIESRALFTVLTRAIS